MSDIKRLFFRFLEPARSISIRDKAVRHLLVGGFGTVIYLAFVAALVEFFSINPVLSVVIGLFVLHIYVYLANRTWVYGATNRHLTAITRFGILAGISFTLNTGTMYLATEVLDYGYVWGLIFATLIVPITNFVISNYWVFK